MKKAPVQFQQGIALSSSFMEYGSPIRSTRDRDNNIGVLHTLIEHDCLCRCGPCKVMLPKLEEMAQELKEEVDIVKVNCNAANKSIGKELNIRVAPTFHLYKNNNKVSIQGMKLWWWDLHTTEQSSSCWGWKQPQGMFQNVRLRDFKKACPQSSCLRLRPSPALKFHSPWC